MMRLDQKIRLLQEIPLLRHFEQEALRVLAFSAGEKNFRAADELFKKGDVSDGGYVIVSGRVALNTRGTSSIVDAEIFGPGTLLGESALIAPTIRPATAIAVEPVTALILNRELVQRVLEAHPRSAVALRRHVAELIAVTRAGLQELAE